MMIDKRLIRAVPGSMRRACVSVGLQWIALVANMGMIAAVCWLLQGLYLGSAHVGDIWLVAGAFVAAAVIRAAATLGVARVGYAASRAVKRELRAQIYRKVLRLGTGYRAGAATSEVVQVAVEGVEQLETYFAPYLPQFFFALLAPLTLFAAVCFINVPAAVVLLVCVPLIPIAIAAVQTWAKKLLSKYWGRYTELGDTFLENLQGLTTLKVYRADEFRQRQMNEQAEQFRRITMRVLTMQLNSIAIMDLVAYGGAAAGVGVALAQLAGGAIDVFGALAIILLAADFFIPMRQLGSFFHIAMNGMAASEKMFRLLDAPEPERAGEAFPVRADIEIEGLTFSYEGAQAPALRGVDVRVEQGARVALVGASGCGKSTLASILMRRNTGYTGAARIGGVPLERIAEDEVLSHITYVGHQSYLFAGTVRENLLMARPGATDDELWEVLARTRLDGFARAVDGLDTMVAERGANLSGGQRQRLAIARALLHDTPIYVFDEATSNIDAESEDAIMDAIRALAGRKTVLLISHRLANVTDADAIYVLADGAVVERGVYDELLEQAGVYARLWHAQRELECFGLDEEVPGADADSAGAARAEATPAEPGCDGALGARAAGDRESAQGEWADKEVCDA